jgi:hypothetical protein
LLVSPLSGKELVYFKMADFLVNLEGEDWYQHKREGEKTVNSRGPVSGEEILSTLPRGWQLSKLPSKQL